MKVDDLSRFPVPCPKLFHSDLSADLGCWTDISTTSECVSVCTYCGSKGHTGAELVSRCDRLYSVILSRHFLQTTLAYTPDLERLAV